MYDPCVLEPLQAGDLPHVVQLFTDVTVRAFLGGPLDLLLAQRRAAGLMTEGEHAWAVRPTGHSPTLLGVVSLSPHHDLDEIEISYLFLPEHWGRGHARAAVEQALAYAFVALGHRRIVAETQSANVRSIRPLEHLGFRLASNTVRFGAQQSIYLAEPASLYTRDSAWDAVAVEREAHAAKDPRLYMPMDEALRRIRSGIR